MASTSQEVVLTATWEHVAVPFSKYHKATPYWLDIAGCDESDRPAANNSRFTYTSPPFRSDFDGQILYLGNHLHDGAVLQEVTQNSDIICSSHPQYAAAGGEDVHVHATPHLSHIPFCSDVGRVAPGDEFSVTATYDTVQHAPMANADGSLEPIMGIALAYVVVDAAPRRDDNHGVGGLPYISAALAIFLLLVVGVGYVLYVVKQRGHWPKWLPKRQAYGRLQEEEFGLADE